MSQPPRPQGPPPSGSNPWYPNDPRQPMSVDAHASVTINQFEPPKNNAPWIIAAVVAVVLGVLVAAAIQVSRVPEVAPTPSSSTAVQPSPTGPASTQPTGNGIPFHSERDQADGFWTIDDSRWTSAGLELTMTIEVTEGDFNYQFFCLDNRTTQDYSPEPGGANSLNEGMVRKGQKVRGVVIFDKPKGDTTVILADGGGKQITALVATG